MNSTQLLHYSVLLVLIGWLWLWLLLLLFLLSLWFVVAALVSVVSVLLVRVMSVKTTSCKHVIEALVIILILTHSYSHSYSSSNTLIPEAAALVHTVSFVVCYALLVVDQLQ